MRTSSVSSVPSRNHRTTHIFGVHLHCPIALSHTLHTRHFSGRRHRRHSMPPSIVECDHSVNALFQLHRNEGRQKMSTLHANKTIRIVRASNPPIPIDTTKHHRAVALFVHTIDPERIESMGWFCVAPIRCITCVCMVLVRPMISTKCIRIYCVIFTSILIRTIRRRFVCIFECGIYI